MSATTTTDAQSTDEAIAAFAASVRAHLDDLPADDVDDLVDGLEADLSEQAAESDGFALPDAAEYAAELRAAAGFPERVEATRVRETFRQKWVHDWAGVTVWIRSSRGGAALLDFFTSVRPVWWIARGWVLFVFLAPLIGATTRIPGFPGMNLGGWILLIVLIVVSVQWGRGRWMPARWFRVVLTIISVVTAIALPIALGATIAAARALQEEAYSGTYVDYGQPGLVIDGERIRNVFAYDSAGQPIESVQLFDQDGRPLTTVGGQAANEGWDMDYYFSGGGGPVGVPIEIPGRAPVWNVFPLAEVADEELWTDGEPDTSRAESPTFPFPFVPALPGAADEQPTPTPTPTPRR